MRRYEEHTHSVRRVDGHAATHAGAPLGGRLLGGARCAVKKSTRIPYAVLTGMLPRVPVRPLRGGLKEARGAPLRRAHASYAVLTGMLPRVPVRPLRGGLKEARGAPLEEHAHSVRRVDGHDATRAGAPLEVRLEGGARCAVKKSTRIPFAVLTGMLP